MDGTPPHLLPNYFLKKISALMTEEYLAARAERGSRDKFERAMQNVADVEPAEHDRL
jgi:hypothetical protein